MPPNLADVMAQSVVVHDQRSVEAAIDRLAGELRRDYSHGERPVFLTVMNGGLWFAARLSMLAGVDGDFDYLHATRYRGQTHGDALVWLARPQTRLAGRRVLVMDDILDEGNTLAGVVAWCRSEGAAEVKVAVLCRKQHDRCATGASADYIGLEVPDRYVFGYGMDVHEQGRQLPAIYAWERPA